LEGLTPEPALSLVEFWFLGFDADFRGYSFLDSLCFMKFERNWVYEVNECGCYDGFRFLWTLAFRCEKIAVGTGV
jgi:hypothetical protein